MRDFDSTFPKTVKAATDGSLLIYQVETTNCCDATCDYCPRRTQSRQLGMISVATFAEVIRVASNKVMALHHFGEPLHNSNLEVMIAMASVSGIDVGFSTNGSLLDQGRLNKLIDVGLKWCRIHTDPFGVRAAAFDVPSHFELTEHSIETNNGAEKKERVSFSGAINGPVGSGGYWRCSFVSQPWVVVLWDGTIATCCHDVNGIRSYDLCKTCSGYIFDSPRDWGHYDG